MKHLKVVLIGALMATAAGRAQNKQAPDVQAIVEKANVSAYYLGDDGRAKVEMTITDSQGRVRQRQFTILRKDVSDGGDQYYYIYFLRPADVRRMTYMVHKHADPEKDDDRWMYLPGLDLVKRIAASDKRTSFVGSDFLYEDVSGRGLEADTHELLETAEEYFLVRNRPKEPDAVKFEYYDVRIDRKTFMPFEAEYYDKAGKLYRTIEAAKIETIQGHPTAVESVAKDLNSGSTTRVVYNDVKYDIGLSDDMFTERYLRRPPREARR
jgi:outer membrane lipoprotein-sorting protein